MPAPPLPGSAQRPHMVLVHASVMPHGAMVLDPKKAGLPAGAADLHRCVRRRRTLSHL